MDERKNEKIYQLEIIEEIGLWIVDLDCFPSYLVGQNFDVYKKFADGKNRDGKYKINEINHRYELDVAADGKETQKFTMQLKLQKL